MTTLQTVIGAGESQTLEFMDCFTAFAMTGESPSTGSGQAEARQSMTSKSIRLSG